MLLATPTGKAAEPLSMSLPARPQRKLAIASATYQRSDMPRADLWRITGQPLERAAFSKHVYHAGLSGGKSRSRYRD